MTQEELDALMAGGLDDLDTGVESATQEDKKTLEREEKDDKELGKAIKEDVENGEDIEENQKDAHEYRADANMAWPPPPPTEDHKMVTQLDDVTKDSEVKATQIFDKLDAVNNVLMDMETDIDEIVSKIDGNITLFEKLTEKFPNIAQFKTALDDNKEIKKKLDTMKSNAQTGEDEAMMAMDIMQYQDIHRQKIERVINVMRALSKYISLLFEGSIDDDKRVGSAVHIYGDENTEDLVTTDDIEAIIESLGKKK
ncbi:MAG: chemotaxis protein [Sulfurospirillum sp.]